MYPNYRIKTMNKKYIIKVFEVINCDERIIYTDSFERSDDVEALLEATDGLFNAGYTPYIEHTPGYYNLGGCSDC